MGLVGIAAISLLSRDVASDMNLLQSAQSDNVQWTLSQSEVEFLEFDAAVNDALSSPSHDLSQLRKRFDVFYSRMDTLTNAKFYRQMRGDIENDKLIESVRVFLDSAAPMIDAPDDRLREALPKISADAIAAREDMRELVVSSIKFFASLSDARRTAFGVTIMRLVAAVAVLVLSLGLLVLYLGRLNSQSVARERHIAQTSQRMNTVMTTSLDAVVVADANGAILEFNSAAETIFGYAASAVMGRPIGEVIVPEKYRDAHDAGMERMRNNGARNVVGKGRVKLEGMRHDGSLFPCELAIQSAVTDEGNIFIAFIRDISLRVAAERELMEARDQALAGERAKTDFLAVMSHEIRTPLNGLLGNLSLLDATRLDDRQHRFVAHMQTSGRQLMRHVTDVLDITRYDAGKLRISAAPMQLNALLQDLVDGQSAAAARHNTTLDWSWIGTPLDWISADRDRLEHILMNLIGNAVKFTRNGKITITFEVVGEREDQRDLEIQVMDNGVGIDPDQLEHIFDDFVTGDTLYDRMTEGTGLGLAIVRRFAEAMDGRIAAESVPMEGSRFTLHVPVKVADPPAEEEAQVEAGLEPVKPRNILVVEDNPINQQVVQDMLKLGGHDVTLVDDGRAAVEVTERRHFDLILMDISMPIMDGRAATRAIRSGDGICAHVPIVALTANAMPDERQAFLADGMTSVLIKPLSRSALDTLLAQLALPTGSVADEMTEISETSEDIPLLDVEQLSEMRGVLGAKFPALLEQFEKETDALLSWLHEEQPLPEISARVHKTTGGAALFGAVVFREQLREILVDARSGIRRTSPSLHVLWQDTKAALRAVL
ncbi:ATP-binding protein [Hoeflea sp. AS60]|uniref:hybrid sensor histidine kinase/response regulator n=1 Tax=Hoeflea sp. AS60 TaxID=3135780 RepID=UPI00317F4D13